MRSGARGVTFSTRWVMMSELFFFSPQDVNDNSAPAVSNMNKLFVISRFIFSLLLAKVRNIS
jgi:hypothetical protein